MNSFNTKPLSKKMEEQFQKNQLSSDADSDIDKINEEIQEHLGKGDISAAMPLFEKAIHDGDTNEELLNNLGYACWESGHKEKALECFYNAAILKPVDMDILANFVDASYELRQFSLLEEYLRVMANANSKINEYRYLLADCLFKQERHTEARDTLEELILKEPDYPGAQELMAEAKKQCESRTRNDHGISFGKP